MSSVMLILVFNKSLPQRDHVTLRACVCEGLIMIFKGSSACVRVSAGIRDAELPPVFSAHFQMLMCLIHRV